MFRGHGGGAQQKSTYVRWKRGRDLLEQAMVECALKEQEES